MKNKLMLVKWGGVLPALLLLSIFCTPQAKAGTFNFYSQQQQITITGRVTDSAGKPLSGVSVQIKGTRKGDITNEYGQYQITAQIGDVLAVSMTGYVLKYVTVADANMPDIRLQSQEAALSDVVVVGFGTQRRGDITSSISTVDIQKDLQAKPFTDIGKGLQGAVPGLQVTYADGGLTASPVINIRGGTSSINGLSPMILVDGVSVGDITQVNPNDIASISVLKDASATSIYGSAAAAGVILITTKIGTRNTRFSLNYNGNVSWSSPTMKEAFADPLTEIPINDGAMQRAGAGNWGQFSMAGSEAGIDTELTGIRNWEQNYKGKESGNDYVMGQDFNIVGGGIYFYRLWDPYSVMYQTMPATNHNINITGGTDKLSYYVSGSYSGQEGILKPNPDNLHIYNILAGVNADVTSWLTISAKMTDRQYNYYSPFLFGNDPIYTMYRWGTYLPYGTYSAASGDPAYYWRSPLGYLKDAGKSIAKNNTVTSLVSATVKFSSHLQLYSDFSYRYSSTFGQSYGGPTPYWEWWILPSIGSAAYGLWTGQPSMNAPSSLSSLNFYPSADLGDFYANTFATQVMSNDYLTYSQKFGLHNLKITAGINVENLESIGVNTGGYDLLVPTSGEVAFLLNRDAANNSVQRQLYSATGPINDYTKYPYITGSHSMYSMAGYFARINYSYADKYLLEVAAREDGSSYYRQGDKWAFFPSVSAGWVVTKEKFAQSFNKVIYNWKIRASYGTNGNPVSADYLATMNTYANSWLMSSGQPAQAVGMPTNIPASLTWEKLGKFDIGTDMSFLKGDLGLTFDWFQNTAHGMIGQGISLPVTFGANPALQNNGNERTRGFELGINYQHTFASGLQVYGNANLFNFISKIVKIGGNPTNMLNNTNVGYYNGETVGEIWGFKTVGFFKDQNDVDNSPYQGLLQSGSFKFGPGDIKYADLDGNDTINVGQATLANHGDLMKIGNAAPRYQYSFRLGASWKGFDIDAYFQGVGSRQMWATGAIAIPDYGGNGELLSDQATNISTYNADAYTDVYPASGVQLTKPNAWWPNPYYGNYTSNFAGETVWANTGGTSGNNFYPQTKYLLNMAYLRLKTLTIGYTLPHELTKKADMQSVRFYIQGMNIWTWSHNPHVPIDPEITDGTSVSGQGTYYGSTSPINKSYAVGVQVTF